MSGKGHGIEGRIRARLLVLEEELRLLKGVNAPCNEPVIRTLTTVLEELRAFLPREGD